MNPLPHSALHSGAVLLTATAVLLAGCAGGPDPIITNVGSSPTGTASGVGVPGSGLALKHTATPVANVASCDVLAQQPPQAGTTADRLPPLQLPCLTPGPDIDLSALRGRPVVVNLWATWCGPCREEMPLLQSSYEQYGSTVQFLGVDTQDATGPAAELLTEIGVTYPQVVDLDGALLDHLRVPGLPVTVILHADGRVAGKHIGELTQASIEDLLGTIR